MVWAGGGTWASGPVWAGSGVPTTTILRPGLLWTEPLRVLVDPAKFLCHELARPGFWDATLTSNRTPIILAEEELRRVNMTERDIITCRTDYATSEPVAITYEYRHENQVVVFRLYTRVSRDHMLRMSQELERLLHEIRLDTFGDLAGDTGRAWLKVVERTHAESSTRKYWQREIRIEVLRRFMKLDQS